MTDQNDHAKEPIGPSEGWRNDPIVEPAPGWSVEVHQEPSFTFTSPEGQKYTVNGPDGAKPAQAFAVLQGWIEGNQKAEAPSGERGPWENYRALASAGDPRFKVDPGGVLSEFEAAVLEECINEVNSAEFLGDLLVFEPGNPDPRICTEACWTACGFDRFLHGPH
jgi:hypothetical protein